MQTVSSTGFQRALRTIGVVACITLLGASFVSIVSLDGFTPVSMPCPSASDERIVQAAALGRWRRSDAVRATLQMCDTADGGTVKLPALPYPVHPPGWTDDNDESGRNHPSPSGFIIAMSDAEEIRCTAILDRVSERNRMIAQRDSLRAAHDARISKVAESFPRVQSGVKAFLAEFTVAYGALKRELESVTITTTNGRYGSYGSTSEASGTQHWRSELNAIDDSLVEAKTIRRPYEALLAVERAVSRYHALRKKIEDIPSAPQVPDFRGANRDLLDRMRRQLDRGN